MKSGVEGNKKSRTGSAVRADALCFFDRMAAAVIRSRRIIGDVIVPAVVPPGESAHFSESFVSLSLFSTSNRSYNVKRERKKKKKKRKD